MNLAKVRLKQRWPEQVWPHACAPYDGAPSTALTCQDLTRVVPGQTGVSNHMRGPKRTPRNHQLNPYRGVGPYPQPCSVPEVRWSTMSKMSN